MKNNRHIFLSNPVSFEPKFNRQRGRDKEDNEDLSLEPKTIAEFQKERLRLDRAAFYTERKLRNNKRSIAFPEVIDLIRIHFFCTFDYDLTKKFFYRYGLTPIEFSQFNKTVTFEITDKNNFAVFTSHVDLVIDSEPDESYTGKAFNLIALIQQFEFINTKRRIFTTVQNGVLLLLISSANPFFEEQRTDLFKFFEQENIAISFSPNCPEIINLVTLNKNQRDFIAENFDIIKAITSARTLKIRPGVYGTARREFGFEVIIPDRLETVGIIDTGVNQLEPIRDLFIPQSYDHTGYGAFWDEAGHGTLVAGLICLGSDFQKEIKREYTAKAKICVIKALHNNSDPIDIPKIIQDIRSARRNQGVRLFNMSLNLPFAKEYNSSYSQFAYELDRLAFEEDILIFLSVGNINDTYLHELLTVDQHPDHEYPTFFYKPDTTSPIHACRNTNISEPSESLNNISIGALAGNLEDIDSSDITPNNLSPAYYTRKFHFDFLRPVNGTPLRKNQRNKFLNKPDMVFDGGDLFNIDSGIEILRSPMADENKFYARTCGTSLATPLIASYAAELLNEYPSLKTQTIKALLINSCEPPKKKNLPHFSETPNSVLKSLTGFGVPQKDVLIFSDSNSITFVIEQTIKDGQILSIPLYLPDYLKKSGNKLKFDITLCYSFMPIKDSHLNYLPLHISVNITKNLELKTIAFGSQDDYGIKKEFSWSEDHFGLNNRLFSNAQTISRNLQPKDIINADGSIAVGIRCLVKSDVMVPEYNSKISYPFSLVVRVTELAEAGINNKLYTEMVAINTVENIGSSENTNDLEAEAES